MAARPLESDSLTPADLPAARSALAHLDSLIASREGGPSERGGESAPTCFEALAASSSRGCVCYVVLQCLAWLTFLALVTLLGLGLSQTRTNSVPLYIALGLFGAALVARAAYITCERGGAADSFSQLEDGTGFDSASRFARRSRPRPLPPSMTLQQLASHRERTRPLSPRELGALGALEQHLRAEGLSDAAIHALFQNMGVGGARAQLSSAEGLSDITQLLAAQGAVAARAREREARDVRGASAREIGRLPSYVFKSPGKSGVAAAAAPSPALVDEEDEDAMLALAIEQSLAMAPPAPPGAEVPAGAAAISATAVTVSPSPPSAEDEHSACAICVSAYEPGDVLRTLPCLHRFHRDCIDPWLSLKPLCPVCKNSVRDAGDGSRRR